MKKEKIQKILQKIQTLPPLPAAVNRLCDMVDDPDVPLSEMVGVISLDAALTARLLRVANSAFYGSSGKVGTIDRAVMILGGSEIRNLALGISIFGVWQNPTHRLPIRRTD